MFLLSPLYYASLLSHFIMWYNCLFNRQTQPFCFIKPLRKSCRIDRYEHGERSMLVFISTVMNMENGRCEMTFSMLSPDFWSYFRKPIGWFHIMKALFFKQAPTTAAAP